MIAATRGAAEQSMNRLLRRHLRSTATESPNGIGTLDRHRCVALNIDYPVPVNILASHAHTSATIVPILLDNLALGLRLMDTSRMISYIRSLLVWYLVYFSALAIGCPVA